MNVGDTIKAALSSLAGGRVTPNKFDQAPQPVWPAIRYTVASRDPDVTIDGTDTGDSDDVRVQIDFVATDYTAAKALRDQGVSALQSATCVRAGEFETYDTETKTHRFVVDFIFSPSTPA